MRLFQGVNSALPTDICKVGREYITLIFVATVIIFKLEKNKLQVVKCIVGIGIHPFKIVAGIS